MGVRNDGENGRCGEAGGVGDAVAALSGQRALDRRFLHTGERVGGVVLLLVAATRRSSRRCDEDAGGFVRDDSADRR